MDTSFTRPVSRFAAQSTQLPAYEEPRKETKRVPKSTAPPVLWLQPEISRLRCWVQSHVQQVKSFAQRGLDQYLSVERKVVNYVDKVRDPREKWLPTVGYIGIAAVVGQAIAQRRGIMARLTYPVLFAVGTAAYFMPNTSSNMAWTLVDPFVPPKQRNEYYQKLQDNWQRAQAFPEELQKHAMDNLSSVLDTAEQTVAKVFK